MLALILRELTQALEEAGVSVLQMVDHICQGKLIHFPQERVVRLQCLVAVVVSTCFGEMLLPVLIPVLLHRQHPVIHKTAAPKRLLALYVLFLIRIDPVYDCFIGHPAYLLYVYCFL